jgi:hypothetical protein
MQKFDPLNEFVFIVIVLLLICLVVGQWDYLISVAQ